MPPSGPQTNADTATTPSVIVGVCGGIACYKVAHVVSRLAQKGIDVTVVMTDAATRFVTPLTFQALSGRPVYDSQWAHIESSDPQHISLARKASLMLIAPCTMNMLAKLATGRTDDVVSLVASGVDLSSQPIMLAPSMNAVMWHQASTQRNLETLASDGFTVLPPEEGWQACRTDGVGRLPDPDTIIEQITSQLGLD